MNKRSLPFTTTSDEAWSTIDEFALGDLAGSEAAGRIVRVTSELGIAPSDSAHISAVIHRAIQNAVRRHGHQQIVIRIAVRATSSVEKPEVDVSSQSRVSLP